MSTRDRLQTLVQDYLGKFVDKIEYVSDSTSTAIRAHYDDEVHDFLLFTDHDPRIPLTAFELEEVKFPIWPPREYRG